MVCYLGMPFYICYQIMAICYSLSLTCYCTIFLKLAITCKNFFLLLVVVRLVIFLRHPFLVIGHSLSSHVTFYIMCHPGHENFYNCALCCLLLLLMVTLDLSLLTCLSWPTTLHMSLFKCHSSHATNDLSLVVCHRIIPDLFQ